MSNLYSQLHLGANAVLAQRSGVAASGHNIANVNTPGHNRVEAQITSNGMIGGIRAAGFSSSSDLILAARERLAEASLGRADDMATATLTLESQVANEATNLVDAIAALFGGIIELSSNPTDVAFREAALEDATSLASAFGRVASALQESREGADERMTSLVAEASALSAQLAATNRELRQHTDPSIADRRDQLARELSQLVGGSARVDSSGQMRFTLEDGTVIVDADRAASFEATSDPALGNHLRIDVIDGARRHDVTSVLSEGRLGAQLEFRDQLTTSLIQEMDQLAYDLATQINGVHRSFAGMDGVTGRDLFVPPVGVQGAAMAMAVDPAVIADPGRLAGADPNLGPGDNAGLLALADLRNVSAAGGNTRTYVDEGLRIMTGLGFTVQRVGKDREISQLRSDSLAQLRDSTSGVSVEEELTNLQSFERASEASAKFIQTVDGLLGTLIDLV